MHMPGTPTGPIDYKVSQHHMLRYTVFVAAESSWFRNHSPIVALAAKG